MFKPKFKTEIKKINEKGQAASTDALIFLGIVSVVFVLILGYSMNYGLNIMNNAKKLYMTNYHYSALKTFMNASYGRDGLPLTPNSINKVSEIPDSVATMIKEDYGANSLVKNTNPEIDLKYINVNTQIAMFGILDDLFLPLPQRSYLLLISHNQSGKATTTPLILLLRTVESDGDNYKPVKYVCYPENSNDIETYLKTRILDLIIVEGSFHLYENILSNENEVEDKKTHHEDGTIYLASWISDEEKIDISGNKVLDLLHCTKFEDLLTT